MRFPDPQRRVPRCDARHQLSGRQLLVRLEKANSAVGGDTMDEVGGKAAGIGASRQPAADAIDPELLAEVEVQLVDQELETSEAARQAYAWPNPFPRRLTRPPGSLRARMRGVLMRATRCVCKTPRLAVPMPWPSP